MTPTIATTTGLTGRGFSHLAAADVRAWLGDDALIGWPAFAASWNDLETDEYMADGGRYRRRRYACYAIAGAAIARQPHRPHYQSRGYNALNGGVDRWFTPVEDRIARDRLLIRFLERLAAAFAAAAQIPLASASVVAYDDTLIRIASRSCHCVPPHQHTPAACTAAMTRVVWRSSPNDTRTWLRSTWLSTWYPAAVSPWASRVACRQQRSTRSARPSRPRKASAAHTSTARARREPSGE